MVNRNDGFSYISHVKNLESIIKYGILSHGLIVGNSAPPARIDDSEIVARRGRKRTPDGMSLWQYANLFFNPRNPMMYRVKEIEKHDVVVVKVRKEILGRTGVFLADGNAAANATQFHPVDKNTLRKIWQQVDREYWNDDDEYIKKENQRLMMAECLVPEKVPPDMIDAVHVIDGQTADRVKYIVHRSNSRLIVNPYLYFLTGNKWEYVQNISQPAPVSRPRSIPQHGVKVAVQRSETHAKPESVSPANAPAAPANTPVAASMIASVGVPASAPTPTRRKTQQTRKSEVRAPAHVSAVSSRAGRKSGMSRLWDWLAFLLMICFVLALYEAIRRLLV